MARVTSRPFGLTKEGQQAVLFTLDNGTTQVDLTNYGAALVAIRTLDRSSSPTDVLLGYDTVTGYEQNGGYFGAVIGRNGNRIKNGRFEINRTVYQMAQNEGKNNLHSGPFGFDSRIWTVTAVQKDYGQSLEFTLLSPDGDQGFPGTMQVCVRYSLTDENALILEYFAKSDQDTIANLTNHAYFNLNGHQTGSVLDHQLKLSSDLYTPVDEDCCPTGEILSVRDTVFDFTEFRRIGDGIDSVPDFSITGGYDHNFILRTRERQMSLAAEVLGDKSGILMQMHTNQPAVQFYAGNMIGEVYGKSGVQYQNRTGFCLETQCCPDAPNHPHFFSPILRAGDVYNFTTVYQFSVRK